MYHQFLNVSTIFFQHKINGTNDGRKVKFYIDLHEYLLFNKLYNQLLINQ